MGAEEEGVRADNACTIPSVMAGLVPAIHVFSLEDVDARPKAGHDDSNGGG